MKKTLIALAVAGFAFNASAVQINYTASPVVDSVQAYAKEITPVAGAVTLQQVELAVAQDASIEDGNYFRFTVTGATLESSDNPNVNIANDGSYALIPGTAAAGVATVLFTVKTTGTTVSPSFVLGQYADLAAATNGSFKPLKEVKGTFLEFVAALNPTITAGDEAKIDVTTGSLEFVGGANASIKKLVTVVDPTEVPLGADGTPLAPIAGEWTLEGPFIVGSKVGGVDQTAETVGKPVVLAAAGQVDYEVDGQTPIATGTVKAVFTPDAVDGLTLSAKTFDPAATLEKNGVSKPLNLVMKPNGAFKHYLRITNDSSLEGNVYLTVYNDAGESKQIALSAVAGQPASLKAQQSTTQIAVNDVWAAAEAAGLTLVDAPNQKLRVVVEGEMPSLSAQSYVLSTDNNALIKFD